MNIIQYMFFVIQAGFLFIVAYLYLLAIASVWPQKKKRNVCTPQTEFAVIVPAHNESLIIGRTLSNIQKQDYPGRQFTIYVIADNCTDDTAAIARQAGVTCFERYDTEKRGKGWALLWAFERLAVENVQHDAFVIIDADTIVAPDFLRIMDERIQGGAKALQGYYDVLRPDRSIIASLSYFGFALNRYLRYKGRTRLGWTSNLLGNGMCFHRDIIQEYGWPATTIVEDLEYGMILLLNDVRVIFVPEARIYAETPESFRWSRTQRVRWDLGKFAVRNMYLPKLLKAALRKGDFAFLDAAMELIIPPFSLFISIVIGCCILFFIVSFRNFDFLFSLWLVILGSLFGYTLLGLVMAKASMKMYKNLLYAPYFLLWRVFITFSGTLKHEKREWVKTRREKVRESMH